MKCINAVRRLLPAEIALSAAAQAAPADFVGTWTVPGETRSITRVVVTAQGGGLMLRAFGKCSTTDCDWGLVPLTTFGSSVTDADHRVALATYDHGFSRATLVLTLRGRAALYLQGLTQFTDSSVRQNYSTSTTLTKN